MSEYELYVENGFLSIILPPIRDDMSRHSQSVFPIERYCIFDGIPSSPLIHIDANVSPPSDSNIDVKIVKIVTIINIGGLALNHTKSSRPGRTFGARRYIFFCGILA